jgi:hypothetical protein
MRFTQNGNQGRLGYLALGSAPGYSNSCIYCCTILVVIVKDARLFDDEFFDKEWCEKELFPEADNWFLEQREWYYPHFNQSQHWMYSQRQLCRTYEEAQDFTSRWEHGDLSVEFKKSGYIFAPETSKYIETFSIEARP